MKQRMRYDVPEHKLDTTEAYQGKLGMYDVASRVNS